VVPSIANAPTSYPWSTTVSQANTVQWTASYSGLQPTVKYQVRPVVGTTVPYTTAPVQPTLGQTTPWEAVFVPSGIQQGVNYLDFQVANRYGTTGTYTGTHILRYDTVGALIQSLLSLTHPVEAAFYNATTATLSWTGTDAGSGLDGYSWDWVATTSPTLDATKDAEETFGQTSFSVDAFGTRYFRIRAIDNLGNVGATTVRTVNTDRIPPDFGLRTPRPDTTTANVLAEVRGDYDDLDGGLDTPPPGGARKTSVDVSTVVFKIDGIDIIATWKNKCAPNIALAPCRMEVTPTYVLYEPSAPWALGTHVVELGIGDTVVGSNRATTTWTFNISA
jgi:hypothetical protein